MNIIIFDKKYNIKTQIHMHVNISIVLHFVFCFMVLFYSSLPPEYKWFKLNISEVWYRLKIKDNDSTINH